MKVKKYKKDVSVSLEVQIRLRLSEIEYNIVKTKENQPNCDSDEFRFGISIGKLTRLSEEKMFLQKLIETIDCYESEYNT